MPNITHIAPWWERWRDWWTAQTLYFGAPQCRGSFRLLSSKHAARWDGTLEAAGRRWQVVIVWGPGTPFFPPRVYPIGCCSAAHQYSDGSMCLSPPATLNKGWHGVPDISFWLKQAVTWFEGYSHGNWSIDPLLWPFLAARVPAPEYRLHMQGTMLIAIPPAWKNGPPSRAGSFHAQLPRNRRGMGAIVEWRSADGKKSQTWPAGEALVSDGESLSGIWEHLPSWDPEALNSSRTRLKDRHVERALKRTMERAIARGRPFVHGFCGPSPSNDNEDIWTFRVVPSSQEFSKTLSSPPPDQFSPEAFQHLFGLLCPGVRLDQGQLERRRIAHRERQMHERIASTTVVLVGLGALGSEVAHLLAQEGVAHFLLIDGDVLLPGNVARHRANLADAGRTKVDAVERDILRITPSASVSAIHGWVEQLVPALTTTQPPETMIVLGLTGHEGSEHVLGTCCTQLGLRCLHAWLERDGTLLRLFRVIPGRDPSLLELANAPDRIPHPPPDRAPVLASAPAECAEVILPGSASNIHAAANFVARMTLNIITGQADGHNHWLFAPGGLRDSDPSLPGSLRRAYGVAEHKLALRTPDALPRSDGRDAF